MKTSTDCSTLVSLAQKDFSEYTNPRLLQLMEKVAGYNLSWHHLPGSRNAMADYLSRYGASNPPVLEDLPSDPKYISSKSQRTVDKKLKQEIPW